MEKSCLFVDALCRCEDLTSVFPSSVELLPPDVSKRGDLRKAAEGKDKEKRWWKNVVPTFAGFFRAHLGGGVWKGVYVWSVRLWREFGG